MPLPAKTSNGCRQSQLFGLWCIDPVVLQRLADQTKGVNLAQLAESYAREWADANFDDLVASPVAFALGGDNAAPPVKPYHVANGVATIGISGPTTKYPTSFSRMLGGTSTVLVQRALRMAKADPDVKAALLHLEDAPGGTVAGIQELVGDIKSFAQTKPIRAHVTDMACSAAYAFASACQRITANHTGHVGSIGVRTALVDTSEKRTTEGVRVIPITTGKLKAIGMDGVAITPEQVAEVQRHVDQLGGLFFEQVAKARGLSVDDVKAMEAGVFMAPEALQKRLIDGICSAEEAHASLSRLAAEPTNNGPGNDRPTLTGSNDMNLLAQLAALVGMAADANEADVLAAARRRLEAGNTAANDLAELRKAAKAPDAESLVDLAEAADGRINNAVAANKLPPVIATSLKERCGLAATKGQAHKPNVWMFTRFAALDNARPVDMVLALHEHAAGQTATAADEDGQRQVPGNGVDSPVQLLPNTPPGGNDAAAVAKEKARANADVVAYYRERGLEPPKELLGAA